MKLTRRVSDRGDQVTQRRVLFADDDPSIATLIQVTLSGPRYDVVVVKNGLEALKTFTNGAFDIVLLDVMMPYVDGFEACKRIREQSDVPIIMLTARDGTDDVLQGFELGSDDYITKPFKTVELIARIEAILRRVEGMKNRQAPTIVRVGDIEIDAPRHRVTLAGDEINLTPMEFELLYFLAANVGEVFDRETLFQEVWGYDYVGETNLVDVCVRRLREKIESEPSKPRRILTVRGVGYKMADANATESVPAVNEPVTEPLSAYATDDAPAAGR
ncbi:MAG: response regulator transcription factor [Chloroflexi bacterium]|nr:response regulator transcription factor [Chloroflexota bacterium]